MTSLPDHKTYESLFFVQLVYILPCSPQVPKASVTESLDVARAAFFHATT